ncbi:response regulator [Paraburkholderia sp. JHI869]|uniref:response regulator n=1 Tax=Paraburkholderia sp. JHI869 TaxID=3112959 RepID=UPI0031788D05
MHGFDCAHALLDAARVRDIAFLIADVRMPGMSGIELHRRLLANGCCSPMVFITAFATLELEQRVAAAGALALLQKPFDLALMAGWLTRTLGAP